VTRLWGWTTDQDRQLIALRAKKATWGQITEVLGRPKSTIRSRYKTLQDEGITEEGAAPAFDFGVTEFDRQVMARLEEKEPAKPIHWRKLLEIANETQGAMEALEVAKDIQERRIPGDPYPIVVYSGDWHLGHKATSYTRWLYEIAMLLRSVNTYLIDLGDNRQNSRSTRHLAWVLSQVLPVELQAQLIVSVTQELVGEKKLLSKIGGTHDSWFDQGVAGEELLRWLYRQNESIAFFENKGLLKLIVEFEEGEKEFSHLLFHKARYRSFLSTLHGNRREYQLTFPAKVVAGAHDHEPGAEMYWHYGLSERAGYDFGGWSWNIKVGAFTSAENQFRDLGAFHHRTEVFCPACVYMPEGIVLLPTLRDALAFRAGVGPAREHEESLIEGLDLPKEQRQKLKDEVRRRFGQ